MGGAAPGGAGAHGDRRRSGLRGDVRHALEAREDRQARPPHADRRAQQRRFDAFRAEFNQARPHEALAQATPASCYTASPRAYPDRLAPLVYPAHGEVRRVSRNGGVRWHNHWVNVSHVLAEEESAFEEIDDALWQVSFGPIALGRFHEALLRIEDQYGDLARTRRRTAPHL